MMLDPDLKSWWLRFWLQQVMLCDIYKTMRICIITRTRTRTHVYIYIYCIDGTNQIVNGVGLYHVCLRYLNDGSMTNHVYIIYIYIFI